MDVMTYPKFVNQYKNDGIVKLSTFSVYQVVVVLNRICTIFCITFIVSSVLLNIFYERN